MLEFSVSKDMKSMLHGKGGDNKEISDKLYLTLVVKKLNFSGEQGRVITTLNILFSVVGILNIVTDEPVEFEK
jgi:hypothetical protein